MQNNLNCDGEAICKEVVEALCRRLGEIRVEVTAIYDMRDQEWCVRVTLENGASVLQNLCWVSLNGDLDELASKIVEAI